MRASCCAEAVLLAALCLSAAPSSAQSAPSQTGVSPLDPAFRLPAGGVALAGPVLDTSSSPAAAWLLSEDLSLYALSEEGKLAARVELAGALGSERPGSFLAVDPFGRVVVAMGGARLSAYTRIGALAWQAAIEPVAGAAAAFPPAFGSDGRIFALSGKNLLCLNPSGARLWTLSLPFPVSCPPGVDGRGYPCIGLSNGSLLILSPYGEILDSVAFDSAPILLSPICLPAAGGKGLPLLAAAFSDGRVLLLGARGTTQASYHTKAAPSSFAWDGAVLYGLDSAGGAFALSSRGQEQWSVPTGCLKGRLYLFSGRLVATGQGKAVSLSLSGEVFRELTIPGASGTPAVSPVGLAYSSGADWVLAAYRFERPLGQPIFPDLPPYPGLPDIVSNALLFDPFASDSSHQSARLADIEKSLRSGTIGKDEPVAAAYCAAVAMRGFDRELSQIERRRAGNPLPRARACYLLGDLGSPAYRDPLFFVLEADADPAVRAAACDALAAIGVEKDGRSMAAFLTAAARPADDRTALVIAAAIEGMALRSGLAPSEDGLRALIKLAAMPYGQKVRSRASTALARISGVMQ